MKKDEIIHILPYDIRKIVESNVRDYEKLQEVRLRSNKPVFIQYENEEYLLFDNQMMTQKEMGEKKPICCTEQEIRQSVDFISKYSVYAFQEQIKQGFITIQGGHRIGLCGDVVMENGQIKTINNIASLNIRVAHEIKHCSDSLVPYLYRENQTIYNTLILSPPMYGKTTLLRDLIRNLSDGYADAQTYYKGAKVGVVDERSEIGASYFGVPQNHLGMRTDVMERISKEYGIMMLVRTMSPNIIALDEIGSEQDAKCIEYGIHCGCKFLATIHGESIQDLLKRESMKRFVTNHMFERFLLIDKDAGKRRVWIYNEKLARIGQVLC